MRKHSPSQSHTGTTRTIDVEIQKVTLVQDDEHSMEKKVGLDDDEELGVDPARTQRGREGDLEVGQTDSTGTMEFGVTPSMKDRRFGRE